MNDYTDLSRLYNFQLYFFSPIQDVMVVGEPALMGGEFGDEDERLITRLENQQFEPNTAEPEENKPFQNNDSAAGGPIPPTNGGTWPQDKKPTPLIEEPKKEPPH